MPDYEGYLGWVTHGGHEPRGQKLPSKELVNSFIAQHRGAKKVIISIGTFKCSHTVFIMKNGCVLLAPYRNDNCGGIGTPELLAEQWQRQKQNMIEDIYGL
ncbi:MAG: hypothetical protein WC459_03930 [Patescibacteria group bacterium]